MRRAATAPLPAALGAAALLLAVYAATLAPGVTLWDAGELIAAVHGLGIPHPPGTPLFVLVGRAWTLLLPGVPTDLATNLLSAVATAAACGVLAWLVARWLRDPLAALTAGAASGVAATVWRNANETEIYALALLLAALTLLAADRAGREGSARSLVLVAYLFALAVPLHLFTLVAAPAAIVLAATGPDGRARPRQATLLLAALLVAAGAGTVRLPVVAGGLALGLAACLVLPRRSDEPTTAPFGRRLATAAGVAGVLALGLGAVVVLLVRARHDPVLDQGHPASWAALLDVVARRQYAVAPLWPRQAPLWLQLGNLLEYADWQFALGVAPAPPPAWGRTTATVAYAVLGVYGGATHRRADRRSWRALLLLLLGGSVGVMLYLNLRAGPSIGAGVLPADAVHEARERDYFFTFAFWSWGAWAGLGALAASRRLLGMAWPGLAVALLPLALNWRATDRARGADATVARDAALALLLPAPRDAVLFAAGDNDTYPLWMLQQVEGVRPDVVVVVTPLLPAAWYRAELASRFGLGPAGGGIWSGQAAAVRAVADAARRRGRPVLLSVLQSRTTLAAAGGDWRLAGAWYREAAPPDDAPPPADSRLAAALRRQLGPDGAPAPSVDPAARAARRVLLCSALGQRPVPAEAPRGSLASHCDAR